VNIAFKYYYALLPISHGPNLWRRYFHIRMLSVQSKASMFFWIENFRSGSDSMFCFSAKLVSKKLWFGFRGPRVTCETEAAGEPLEVSWEITLPYYHWWPICRLISSGIHFDSGRQTRQEKGSTSVSCFLMNVPIFSHQQAWLFLLVNTAMCLCHLPWAQYLAMTFPHLYLVFWVQFLPFSWAGDADSRSWFYDSLVIQIGLSEPFVWALHAEYLDFGGEFAEPFWGYCFLSKRNQVLWWEKMGASTGEQDIDSEPFSWLFVGWSWSESR
jgi:hypothetical protein